MYPITKKNVKRSVTFRMTGVVEKLWRPKVSDIRGPLKAMCAFSGEDLVRKTMIHVATASSIRGRRENTEKLPLHLF